MKLIESYIGRNLIATIALTTLVLLAMELFFVLNNELKLLGRHQYQGLQLIQYVLLTTPRRCYFVLPWGALLGTILGLGQMAQHNELLILRSIGLSPSSIALTALKSTLKLIILFCLLGELIAPSLDRYASEQRLEALSNGQAIKTAYGTWIRNNQGFIHIQDIRSNTLLENITWFKIDDKQVLSAVTFAERARFAKTHWLLEKLQHQTIGIDKVTTTQELSAEVPHFLANELIDNLAVKNLEFLSFKQLLRTISHHRAHHLNTFDYELAFYNKLLRPVTVALMILLAVSSVFGPLREVNQGARLLVGLSLAFVFQTLNGITLPLVQVLQWPSLLGALTPAVLFGLAAWLQLQRAP